MRKIDWNPEKNEILKLERGISFEEVVNALRQGKILDHYKHPNKEKYPNQEIFVVEIEGNAFIVPFVSDDELIFLKTIYRSRKATKIYLGPKEKQNGK